MKKTKQIFTCRIVANRFINRNRKMRKHHLFRFNSNIKCVIIFVFNLNSNGISRILSKIVGPLKHKSVLNWNGISLNIYIEILKCIFGFSVSTKNRVHEWKNVLSFSWLKRISSEYRISVRKHQQQNNAHFIKLNVNEKHSIIIWLDGFKL